MNSLQHKINKKQNTTVEREGGELVEREVGFHTSSMNGVLKKWMTFGWLSI